MSAAVCPAFGLGLSGELIQQRSAPVPLGLAVQLRQGVVQ